MITTLLGSMYVYGARKTYQENRTILGRDSRTSSVIAGLWPAVLVVGLVLHRAGRVD